MLALAGVFQRDGMLLTRPGSVRPALSVPRRRRGFPRRGLEDRRVSEVRRGNGAGHTVDQDGLGAIRVDGANIAAGRVIVLVPMWSSWVFAGIA